MASNFIVAFINITRKYFANTCFHEEMLNQVNILRTFRLILVLENVGEYVQHAVFEAIIDYTDEIAFCERIVKDELFSMVINNTNSVVGVLFKELRSNTHQCIKVCCESDIIIN